MNQYEQKLEKQVELIKDLEGKLSVTPQYDDGGGHPVYMALVQQISQEKFKLANLLLKVRNPDYVPPTMDERSFDLYLLM